MKRILSFLLCLCLMVSLCGCTKGPEEAVVSSDFSNSADPAAVMTQDGAVACADFGIRLLRGARQQGKSLVLSPVSVLYALGMTVNGADTDTLAEMETVLGIRRDDLDLFLKTYMAPLPDDENCRVLSANKIWFTSDSRFAVKDDFLDTISYYADWERAPMDEKTRKAINRYVKERTDGRIPEILDILSEDTVMCLVNALCFDAKWQTPYEKTAVQKNIFTRADGSKKKTDFLYSTESDYLENDVCTGFLKKYEGGSCVFAALLPKEGVSMEEFLQSFAGDDLHRLLTSPAEAMVETALPKFRAEYGADLSCLLSRMGMPLAFDEEKADFSLLGSSNGGNSNIFMDRVLHKAILEVDEEGTRAAAATVVEMQDGCAAMPPEEIKKVYCDRPFVYLVADCETMTPLFMGIMEGNEL